MVRISALLSYGWICRVLRVGIRMAENNDELLDYEEQEDQDDQVADGIAGDSTARKDVRGTYVSIHSSGFRDFLLKPELLRAIVDCGFEHPSEGLLLCLLYLVI